MKRMMGEAGVVHKRYVEVLLLNIGKGAVETEAVLKHNRIIDRNKMGLLLFTLKLNLTGQFSFQILPEACVSSSSSVWYPQIHKPTDIPLTP
jgi:hypothetical protein